MILIKRRSLIVLLIFVLMLSPSTNVFANSGIGTLTLVPVRETFENLGYNVIWNQNDNTIQLILNESRIFLTTRNDYIVLDNNVYDIIIISGKAYINVDYLRHMGLKYKQIESNVIKISQDIKIGSYAPIIKTEDFDDSIMNKLNVYGKKKILFFWATWCPYCTDYINELNKISDTDLINTEIISINIDDPTDLQKVEQFLENNLINATNILDNKKEIFSHYNPDLIPTTYIINEDGIVVDLIVGPITSDEIIRKINE